MPKRGCQSGGTDGPSVLESLAAAAFCFVFVAFLSSFFFLDAFRGKKRKRAKNNCENRLRRQVCLSMRSFFI